ncbi:hypothetical protein X777_02421, partial [Ooceraea biroi]
RGSIQQVERNRASKRVEASAVLCIQPEQPAPERPKTMKIVNAVVPLTQDDELRDSCKYYASCSVSPFFSLLGTRINYRTGRAQSWR